MYCPKCGKELDDEAVMCPSCGLMLDSYIPPADTQQPQANQPKKMRNIWKLIVGFLLLSFGARFFSYSTALFLVFCLIGGGMIFWWLLWDIYPKDKKEKSRDKEKSDHLRGPDLS